MISEDILKDVDLKKMLDEEKKARLDNEFAKGAELCVKILKIFAEKKDYDNLVNFLLSLNKKRSQSREAISQMVKYCLNELYAKLTEDEQIKLLKSIIEVTEGRIFLEYEFSRAIRQMTELHLKRGDVEEGAKLIQDVQIEAFGSLERSYKVDYILFQMRILLKKGDYIRTLIVSNKINRRHLNDEGLELLKIEFYQLMIKYYLHEEKFIDVSKSYKILFDFIKNIENKLANPHELKHEIIENYLHATKTVDKQTLFYNYVMYLAICPPELETKNMFNELNLFYKKDLESSPDMLFIVKKRLSDDIVFIDEQFLSPFVKYPIFTLDEDNNPKPEKHIVLFRKYWIQHDLTIFQKFFSQVRLERIGTMVGVPSSEVEMETADMVINNRIYAKINRINSTVNFKRKTDHHDILNDLNYDLSKMLDKIEMTCHLIHKENLKYDIK